MSKKTKQIILGVAIILAAIAGAVALLMDNDPLTQPDIPKVIEEVQKGVEIIKEAEEKDTPAVAPVPATPAPVEPTSMLKTGNRPNGGFYAIRPADPTDTPLVMKRLCYTHLLTASGKDMRLLRV